MPPMTMPNDPIRIAMIGAKGVPATVGGVERIVEELSARLVARGHHVTVYCRRGYTGADSVGPHRGVERRWIPSLPGKYSETLTHAFGSVLDALGRPFDVLHVHSLGVAPVVPLARILGRKVLFHIHGQEWKGGKWGPRARAYFKACEPIGLRWSGKSVVNSLASRDYYRQEFNQEAMYIPNAVEPSSRRSTDILPRLGLMEGGYLLFVGRLVPEKGCHDLLAAHQRLSPTLPLVICGEPAHSEEYAGQLRREAGPGVIFAGTVLGDELTDLYGGARLLVNPTYRDAVSLVLLEAMAQGTPVLASDIPEMLEGLAGTGRHFRTGDVGDLIRQLQDILADGGARESMSALERRRVESVYAWDPVVDQFENAYREVLA